MAEAATPMAPTSNIRVREMRRLISPRALRKQLPLSDAAHSTVVAGRDAVTRIIRGEDSRLLLVVGPCSIHEAKSALEYAKRLNAIRTDLADTFEIVMRVYFEKPRTTIGWKGMISDPHLDGSEDIEAGLTTARSLLLQISEMGLPSATEFLDPVVPQYIADLVSWAAIGARTTESQTHRMMASGLSMPVGYKNATDGSLQIAIDAMSSAMTPHSFLGIDEDGAASIIRTTGNSVGHVVLRGGRQQPNYDPESIRSAEAALIKAKLPPRLMVDCSHANSAKQPARQEDVWRSLVEQRRSGTKSIMSAMIESHLFEGSQPIPQNLADLRYGISVTDACLGWDATERILRAGYTTLKNAL
jgi:3-deoxy-7-phosphoheptulonate synthase